jgi:plastocyanin
MLPRPSSTVCLVITTLPMVLASCGSSDDPMVPEPGIVQGVVQDASVTGIGGATLTLTRTGHQARTASSASDGTFSFIDVPAGGWMLGITPPEGHQVAPGQSFPMQVQVQSGSTTSLTIELVASAGGNGNGPGDTPDAEIVLTLDAFVPDDVTVPPGSLVRWSNNSVFAHTVTPTGHSEWAGAGLDPDTHFDHTFATPGTFDFHCEIHAGMSGTVRVE